MKLVLFDVDGTLVDSQAHIMAAMTHAFERAGRQTPSRAEVLSIVGLSLPQAMARLAPDLDDTAIARLVDGYRASFMDVRRDAPEAAPLYPNAAEVLERLRDRDDVLLGLATGKSRRGVRHLLDAHALHGAFVTVQTADDHPSKPHPSMIESALDEAAVTPTDAVMIGDTTFDIEMAGHAGVHAIGVGWGYHPANDLTQAGAAVVLEDFNALLPYLARIGVLP